MTSRYRTLAGLFIIGLACGLAEHGAAAEGAAPTPRASGGLVAMINDEAITAFDLEMMTAFENRMLRQRMQDGATDDEREREAVRAAMQRNRESAIQDVIDTTAIYAEFQRRGFQVPPSMVEERLATMVEREAGGDWDKFRDELAKRYRMTLDKVRAELRKRLAVDLYLREEVSRRIRVAPKDVRAWYDAHPDQFREPAELRVQFIILLPGQDAAALQARLATIAAALTAGEDFLAVARKHSDSPLKDQADDIGWRGVDTLHDDLRKAVGELAPGAIGGPVQFQGTWCFLRIAEVRGGLVRPFAEVSDRISQFLYRAEYARRYEALVGRLRQQVVVRRFD